MSEFPVQIQDQAWDQISRLLHRKGQEGQVLRIGVKGGGCSGLEYVIRLDSPRDTDFVVERDGVAVACDPKSAAFLEGAELVWTGNLIGGGFSFENPNAQRSCGCGTSFTPVDRPKA